MRADWMCVHGSFGSMSRCPWAQSNATMPSCNSWCHLLRLFPIHVMQWIASCLQTDQSQRVTLLSRVLGHWASHLSQMVFPLKTQTTNNNHHNKGDRCYIPKITQKKTACWLRTAASTPSIWPLVMCPTSPPGTTMLRNLWRPEAMNTKSVDQLCIVDRTALSYLLTDPHLFALPADEIFKLLLWVKTPLFTRMKIPT